MNILFISNDPSIFVDTSATHARMRAYADEVGKRGGVLHILSRAAKPVEKTIGPLVLHGVAGNPLWVRMSLSGRARTLIKKESIGVVSAQDPFEFGWIALRAVQGTNAKLHVQIHTDFRSPWFIRGSLKNRLRCVIADRVLPRAHGIRVVSKRIKDSLGALSAVATVIPIPVDAGMPPKAAFPHEFGFNLFFAGRLEPEKRIGDLLEALASVRKTYPNAGLTIAGTGSQRALLEQRARTLGLTEHVQFLGHSASVRALMQSAQAYVQASAYEGYGITLVEAALAHIPIITTDVGIVGDVLNANESALVSNPGDVVQLAHNMRTIIESTGLRSSLIMNAESAVRSHLAESHSTPAAIIADIARLV